jgi:hypothetical protein
MLVMPGEAHAAGKRATAGGRQDARWHHLARHGRKVQAVAVCLNAGDVMSMELGTAWSKTAGPQTTLGPRRDAR